MNHNFTGFVGDANGADRCVQQYLLEKQYRNVLVFCTGPNCRNNIGKWETRHITPSIENKGFNFYVLKDQQMEKLFTNKLFTVHILIFDWLVGSEAQWLNS